MIVPIRVQTGATIAPTSVPVSSPLLPPLLGADVGVDVDVEAGVAVVSMDVCDCDAGAVGLAVIEGVKVT